MNKLVLLLLCCFLINSAQSQNKPRLKRGPYLQMVGEETVTFRWRTTIPSDSRIAVGTALGSYPIVVTDSQLTTEHIVTLNGLTADTKYFYQIGSSNKILQSGKHNFFVTAPDTATKRKIRIAAFGDCGRNWWGYGTMVLNAYRRYTREHPPEVLLLLGDNAYQHGTDAQYQKKFFNRYGSTILRNHALFPAPGNHDYAENPLSSRALAYYDNFTVPTNGELGGVPSGTEAYYSYNWGNIHFVSLDSYGMEDSGTTRLYDTLGAQVTWLKKDLAANQQQWTIVYWHHPPFSMGSHNSDKEDELIKIRTNLLRIVERYGVDLVLTGHSHDYERSYLLRNYYEPEASFQPKQHAVSTSSGYYNGSTNSCPYLTTNGHTNHGIVYVVSGSAGARGRIQKGYPHNALPFAFNKGGMVYLEVEDNRLDVKFIGRNANVRDQFTIMKEVQQKNNLTVKAGTPITLTASWVGAYSWSTGDTTRSITVTPTVNTNYTVQDGSNCINDRFSITVQQTPNPKL